ncbi:DNA mismatch repair endonuclease MutL [bacterium]|nr:DNA mismatch repair endonuclease MutL [bacterium]
MPKVQRLDPLVAERIAAGEVVERPASAIKELVENSLDAGARQIIVELVGGGMHLLRVIDDGCGMSAEDVKLALERFATSKIRQWEDLDALSTLGFRGEALPSIAAVSKLEIHTCEAEANHGTKIRVEGGVLVDESPSPALVGTRVTVEELFYNTPARLKFLKSAAAETSQVVDLLTRMALTQPEVHFQVRSNQREVFLVTSKMTLPQRMAALWKVPLEDLVEVNGEVQGVEVRGWVAKPQHARPTRNHQLFCLNGRIIKSASLSQAVLEGFTPLVSKGRYPVALLHLSIDPSLIDVNVHPTKAEVRFAEARAPFRAIYRSIATSLEEHSADSVQPQHWDLIEEPPVAAADPPAWRESSPGYQAPPPRPQLPYRAPSPGLAATLELFKPIEMAPHGPRIQVLTQLYRTFIVAQVDGELWVVDQHTAHERIWYEKLAHLQPLDGPRQGLLVPEIIEFSPPQAALLEGSLAEIQSFGFEIEPFGGTSFQMRSLPSGVKPGRAAGIIRDLVDQMSSEQISLRNHPQEVVREKLRAMVSCKAAIKAGDPLSVDEMESLIREMLEVEHSNYCPHGRPTRIKLDDRALERLFHR